MGLYNRFCKRFFAAVIIRLTAQSDSRAPLSLALRLFCFCFVFVFMFSLKPRPLVQSFFDISTRFSLSTEMSRQTRDGTVEHVSRDKIIRRDYGQGNICVLYSADHMQDWQPYPLG